MGNTQRYTKLGDGWMIKNLKETYPQEMNRKLVKTLGYIPFHITVWGRKEDEPGDPPAELSTICPKCFNEITLKNNRESIKWEKDQYNKLVFIEGNRWGYQLNVTKKIPYSVGYFSCQSHLLMIDLNDQSTGSLFRIYEEAENE